MSIYVKTISLLILMFSVTPQPAFAIRDTITGAISDAGKFAQDVGKTADIGVTAKEIDQDVTVALDTLLKSSTAAAKLAKTAKAILVYPRILKAGLGVGGQHGNGALRQQGLMAGAGIQGSKISKINPKN